MSRSSCPGPRPVACERSTSSTPARSSSFRTARSAARSTADRVDHAVRPGGPGGARPTVLTWGLIGPGKGIEWAIDALGGLADLPVAPRYLVAGQTHPKVLSNQGDVYRDSLRARAAAGRRGPVEFDARYRNAAALMDLVRQADIVLLPYDSSEQVTSGVLIEAIAACRPVVAADFPHAEELLAGRRRHSWCRIATRPPSLPRLQNPHRAGLAASMSARSARIAPDLEWSAVANRTAHWLEIWSFSGRRSRPTSSAGAAFRLGVPGWCHGLVSQQSEIG